MKHKYTPLAILLAMLLITPAFAFWHPPVPEPECPYFGLTINGEARPDWAHALILEEPEDSYCDILTVEVWIANVEDLYGYEFTVSWNTVYFSLVSYTVADVWPSQFVVYPEADYDMSMPYKQVVSAMAPSTGVTGDFLLATLEFHIDNDVCWLQGDLYLHFDLGGLKASDSCSGIIELCDPMHGYVIFKPVKPKVFMDPEEEINSKVGDKFTVTIWIENVVKMTDFYFEIYWHGKWHTEEGGFWTAILMTTKADVVINEEVFPTANRTSTTLAVTSPKCGRYVADPVGRVDVGVVMEPTYPLINGTFWAVQITFTKCDPWYCGAQPDYEPKDDHDWLLETAETDITIYGWLSVKCPESRNMVLHTDVLVEFTHFIFAPIPGDLDGSGHVDLTDIMIIASLYGLTWPPYDPPYYDYYYDLNKDGVIDVYDIVIVAKNFCRTEPNLDP